MANPTSATTHLTPRPLVRKGSLVDVEHPYYRERPCDLEDDLYIAKHGNVAFLRRELSELWNTPGFGYDSLRASRRGLVSISLIFLKLFLLFFVLPALALMGWVFELIFGWNPMKDAAVWCGSHVGWLIESVFGDFLSR
jgi:hypothetical protein